MAYHDTAQTHAADLPHRIAAGIKNAFSVLGQAMIAAASANRRLKLVERLNEKSDAELAQMGLRREDIVRRVFSDMLDV